MVFELKWGHAAGDCRIPVEFLETDGESMTRSLRAVIVKVLSTGEKKVSQSNSKGEWRRKDCNKLLGMTLFN